MFKCIKKVKDLVGGPDPIPSSVRYLAYNFRFRKPTQNSACRDFRNTEIARRRFCTDDWMLDQHLDHSVNGRTGLSTANTSTTFVDHPCDFRAQTLGAAASVSMAVSRNGVTHLFLQSNVEETQAATPFLARRSQSKTHVFARLASGQLGLRHSKQRGYRLDTLLRSLIVGFAFCGQLGLDHVTIRRKLSLYR